jgi:hypothetical protein
MAVAVGDRVNRPEDREVVGATVLELKDDGEEGVTANLAYDEGGEGWWPAEALLPPEERVPPDPERLAARRAAMQMTPRQLFIGLATAGFITQAEAIAAAAGGSMPAAVEAAIAPMPPEAQFAARITWARMTLVNRTDPLVALLAAHQGLGVAELDAFFETFAQV